MADKTSLKAALRAGIPAYKRHLISEAQVSRAAETLIELRKVSPQILENVGASVANDRQIFASVDIDDIVTILNDLID